MFIIEHEYKLKTKQERLEYFNLIKKAKISNRNISDDIYYEKHHIFPKSLFPEWKKHKNNIVLLTRDEHLLAHKLLVVIFPSKEMSYAYNFMTSIIHVGITNSEISKELWKDTSYRERVMTHNALHWKDKNNRKKQSDKLKQFHELHPEVRYSACKSTKQKVRNIETNIVFDSITEAAKWAGLKNGFHIGEVCRHLRPVAGKTPNGLPAHWEYDELSIRHSHKKDYYEACMNR